MKKTIEDIIRDVSKLRKLTLKLRESIKYNTYKRKKQGE